MAASSTLDATFSALSDPTRRAILARLASGQVKVTDLARPFSVSLPAISRHLRVLEAAGLVARKKEGRTHKIALVAAPMKAASDWISRYSAFWQQRLDALEAFLEETGESEDTEWNRKKPNRRLKSAGSSGPRAKKSSGRGRNRNS